MSGPERQCLICHFVFSPDDWAFEGAHSAICLRCWLRETGQPHPVSSQMEREVRAVLAGVTAWIPEG